VKQAAGSRRRRVGRSAPPPDHAGVSIVERNDEIDTPAASDDVPRHVDELQYESNEGPCLDAIREHAVFQTDDLRAERRWPNFSTRATRETGVRSVLSFRLFVEQDTLGALNLYSKRTSAFDADSRRIGEVFAAHAAVALEGARERDRAKALEDDLRGSQQQARRYARQAQFAVALQRSILSDLPDGGPLELAARYVLLGRRPRSAATGTTCSPSRAAPRRSSSAISPAMTSTRRCGWHRREAFSARSRSTVTSLRAACCVG